MKKLTFAEAQYLHNCIEAGISNEPYPFRIEDYKTLHQLVTDATLHDYDETLKSIVSLYIKRINPTVVEWEPKTSTLYFYTPTFSKEVIQIEDEVVKSIHVLCEEYRTYTHTPIWSEGEWLLVS